MLESEVELIRQAQAGSEAAFTQLYDHHYTAVFTYLYNRLPEQATAEELTAQVFVRMVEKIDTYCPQGKPILAWLYTIARHALADYYRQEKKVTRLPLDDRLPADTDPARTVMRNLEADCLRHAINQLTEEQKQVIVGKFIENRSNWSMAQLLGKSEGAVKSLQHRALAALRRVMEREGCYE
jgi:RNA polymerase sigma-70 factor (ECF subfamily)